MSKVIYDAPYVITIDTNKPLMVDGRVLITGRQKLRFTIDGVDWSEYINPYALEYRHEKVQGQNAGMSLGGTDIFDTVRIRSCFSGVIGLIRQPEYAKLMQAAKKDCCIVGYDDPDEGRFVERVMIVTTGAAKQIPLIGDGFVFKNITIDFRER